VVKKKRSVNQAAFLQYNNCMSITWFSNNRKLANGSNLGAAQTASAQASGRSSKTGIMPIRYLRRAFSVFDMIGLLHTF
jgi:hypothetical protein